MIAPPKRPATPSNDFSDKMNPRIIPFPAILIVATFAQAEDKALT